MLGTSLQFGRRHNKDRFYSVAKARRSHHQSLLSSRSSGCGTVAAVSASSSPISKDKAVATDSREPDNRAAPEEATKSLASTSSSSPLADPSPSNLDRFLEATTPSIPAKYLPKTTMRGRRTCLVEYTPYFILGQLWDAFKEWSAYGAGVPLVLNGSDCVVQYYVPYLSGIQLYGEASRQAASSSESDCCRDSCSDGSSDSEYEKSLIYSMDWSCNQLAGSSMLRMDRLSLREKHVTLQEGSSSDDGEAGNLQGCLLFEYLEQDSPYSREPLADKVSDLASRYPELRTLRSCDLLLASWISVAWYPIYRIPTGPTLKDLDACFLTFHSLSTPLTDSLNTSGPVVTYPEGIDGVPKISLPVFGLASYKFKNSMWTSSGGSEKASSLLQAADDWLRLLNVHHPDYQFFASNGAFRR